MSLNSPLIDWHDRRVWIIGASSGIGAALARALLARGARVAVSARREEALAALVERGGHALVLPFDVNDAAKLAQAEHTLVETWGGYDLVVYMAGDYTPMPVAEFKLARAQELLNTNLRGALNALSVVLPRLLLARRGAIALVASVAGYRGLPQSLVYGPTKAALINLSEALYLELRPHGIEVFLINPGFVATPLTAGNKFTMPALISAERAAAEIIRGFAHGRFEIHFPRRFTGWLKVLRLLPYAWYFPLVRRLTRG